MARKQETSVKGGSTSSDGALRWWLIIVVLVIAGVITARIIRAVWAPLARLPESEFNLNLA
jgi:hypothetical protein